MSILTTEVISPLLDEQVAANKRRASLVVAGFALLVFAAISVIGLIVGAGALGLGFALVTAGALTAVAYSKSEALVLSMTDARLADPVAHARLHNLVEGLCTSAGLPKPAVHLVDDDALNAFAIGRGPRNAAVAVTTGLLARMNRIELEGILAHELCHVKNHDVLVSTLAAAMVGPLALVLPVAPVARLLRMATGAGREELADLSGVTLTRYPPGLIAGLEKLRDGPTAVQRANRATAHLWLASPLAGIDADRFGTHPPLDLRIAVLREL